MESVQGLKVSDPLIQGNAIAVGFELDFTAKGAGGYGRIINVTGIGDDGQQGQKNHEADRFKDKGNIPVLDALVDNPRHQRWLDDFENHIRHDEQGADEQCLFIDVEERKVLLHEAVFVRRPLGKIRFVLRKR